MRPAVLASLAVAALAAATAAPDGRAPAADGPAPPGRDGFSETVLRAASPTGVAVLAVSDAIEPRIAFVRAPEGEPGRLDVVRRAGAVWTAETVATGVAADRTPQIRIGPDGATHVAWIDASGGVACATDAGGTWSAVLAVPGDEEPQPYSLAVAPDGTRHVLYGNPGDGSMRVASEGLDGWSAETLAGNLPVTRPLAPPGYPLPWDSVSCALAFAADGTAWAAWPFGGITVASRTPGAAWSLERPYAWAYDVPSSRVSMALDGGGRPLVGFVEYISYDDLPDVTLLLRTDEGWERAGLVPGVAPALGFGADGVARGVAYGITAITFGADGTRYQSLDRGPSPLRSFHVDLPGWRPEKEVAEKDRDVEFLVTSGGWQGFSGVSFAPEGGAIDRDGGFHAAYVHDPTGDLRYASNRDPGRPAATFADVGVTGGTASPANDFDLEDERLTWAEDDSGTKHRVLRIRADTRRELNETIQFGLTQLGPGLEADERASATITILEPPDTERGTPGWTFVPERIDVAADRRVTVRAALHTGTGTLDPRRPATLRFGAQQIEIAGFRRARGGWAWDSGTTRVRLRRAGASPSRWTCDIDFDEDPGERPFSGGSVVEFESGGRLARSGVAVRDGVPFRLGTTAGYFEGPEFHVRALSGRCGPLGTLSFAGAWSRYSGDVDGKETSAGGVNVEVSVNGRAVASTPAPAFRQGRYRSAWRSGWSRAALDSVRGTIRARYAGVRIPDLPNGTHELTFTITLGVYRTVLPTRVVVRDGRISW